ncbi:MAG: PadR family transcriptional regulator [Betaproteobacteria bacterium RIFCSPLOWO2_02_FULL_67_26]|nr:MAG: PadR family transcriptional regulator [Betaproteobacteria bacterium RIFCSPLOWO2_02_FULL_67_26]
MGNTDLYGGLIRLHILHHAAREPVFGLGIIDELARHGYRLSPGTVYPMLHSMEQAGYLRSRPRFVAGKTRRNYAITAKGRSALAAGKEKVTELFGELFEDA